jgi:hypothetical protein
MTAAQILLLLTYITNEIQLASLRSSGMPWQAQLDIRNGLIEQLEESCKAHK